MKEIVKIGAVILSPDRRALLVGRKIGRDIFIIPGGKPEAGEDDLQALLRELSEELGVGVVSSRHFGSFTEPAAFEHALLHMRVYEVEIDGAPLPQSEIEELRWVDAAYSAQGIGLGSTLEHHVIPRLLERGDLSRREAA